MKMGRRIGTSSLILAGSVLLCGLQPAGAINLHPEKPNAGKLTMSSLDPFGGRIDTPDPACENRRPIRVLNAANQSLVTSGRSGRGNEKRATKWAARIGFVGTAFAIAPRHDGCGQLRSNTVTFFPPINPTQVPAFATADLAITKVSSFHDGMDHAQYTITVTNNGPSQANGVIVTDDPEFNFFATGSDPRCGPDDGAVFTCNIGSISPFVQVQLFVKVDCPNVMTTNSASVASSTTDPNLGNNATGVVVNNPC